MAEYIEREAALKFRLTANLRRGQIAIAKLVADAFVAYIEAIPAADVVPVVRCGECAYHDTADYGGGCSKNVCRLLNRQIQDDDYCSYACRKDGCGE